MAIEQFAIRTEEGARDSNNRKITETKLDTAATSGDLFQISELKVTVLEVVKAEDGLYFVVDYDLAKQGGR